MFLYHLSASILRLCASRNLSYEAAAQQCNLSARYFGSIARGKTAPTISTLEKLCSGFQLTPNDLLLPLSSLYREPMPVTHIRCINGSLGLVGFPVCPCCGITMDREYLTYCDRCGQRLDWKNFSKATIILPEQ